MFYDVNRFHLCVFVTWQLVNFAVGQYIFNIFSIHVPKWKCGDGPVTKDCKVYQSCPKDNLTFVDPIFTSVAMDFDWVCGSSAHYQSFFSLVQYLGVLVGTVLFGTLSDKYGRKPIGILVIVIAIISLLGTGLSPNRQLLFIARFCSGLSIAGVLVCICAWILESILSHQRMVIRAFFNWGWTRVFITVVCYLTQEWRLASYVCAACLVPALLMLIFLIPESAIWLHSKGETAKMIESEKFMAKIAGVSYVPIEHKLIHSKTLLETLNTKGLFKKLFVLWIMWFFVAVCGFANDLNSNSLAGNLYLNQALFGILLVLSKIVLLFVDTKFENFKRRTLHQGSQSGMIISFLILAIFLWIDYHGTGFLIVYLFGTMFIEYTWDAVYLCAIESMETSSRASAVGSCSLMARIGSLLAPFLTYANTWWPPAVYFTIIVLGTVNLIISFMFLQETKNVNLDEVQVNDDEAQEEKIAMLQT
ncbi:Major facilitator superfamily (MFS) profile domain-containing protein [Caenorhabditis elegans]|uniref:Major facilitator superfamily (MFS) profile domain-containing protein n=1 Tax=Caenorhabditis elegans TaxID=6239 RepID=Q18613_CAEEL|nr:Major facilitator superfamily (MFS) profile domain-containing protein [Caenorhabditis elegans]CAA93635.2 Major facilitator superfamily (MFS) profile domain-containing protein [Caenorhabditis elegans]|eukprot:NP_509958.2 Uncharacterized protein CELE_C44C10.3 [Caenorhabditis elegans]